MELIVKNKEIILDGKEVNNLDKFVVSFAKILEKHTDYVIVSGYTAIFFGRTRATEDIDIFIKNRNVRELLEEALKKGYWIVNTNSIEDAIDLLNSKLAIRIARKNVFIPNFEIKLAGKDTDFESLNNRVKIIFDKNVIYFSPIEIQLAYKLFLGSDKDYEDARHLFNIFKDKIDIEKLKDFSHRLNVHKKLKKLGDIDV